MDAQVDALIEERNQARKDRDFARSDEIRDLLKEQGIVLEDTRKERDGEEVNEITNN